MSGLAGIVGAYCSTASSKLAEYGNVATLPQISYASTADELNNFAYFFRTCWNDEEQAVALSSIISSQLSIHACALVYKIGDIASESFSYSFRNSYLAGGNGSAFNHLLFEKGFTDCSSDKKAIAGLVLETGTPCIVITASYYDTLCLLDEIYKTSVEADQLVVFLNTGGDYKESRHQGMNYIDAYNDLNTSFYNKFINLWKTLNPKMYPDANGNRNNLESYSAELIDAIIR